MSIAYFSIGSINNLPTNWMKSWDPTKFHHHPQARPLHAKNGRNFFFAAVWWWPWPKSIPTTSNSQQELANLAKRAFLWNKGSCLFFVCGSATPYFWTCEHTWSIGYYELSWKFMSPGGNKKFGDRGPGAAKNSREFSNGSCLVGLTFHSILSWIMIIHKHWPSFVNCHWMF